MRLVIDLPPGFEQKLRAEAARLGQTPEQFAVAILMEQLGFTYVRAGAESGPWERVGHRVDPDLDGV